MCKLLAITGPLSENAALGAIEVANVIFAKTQTDGFGFVAEGSVEERPALAWGRYDDPDKFTTFRSNVPGFFHGDQSEQGTFPKLVDNLLVHGRTSTNTRGLLNAHPFRRAESYIIHNGILEWGGDKDHAPPSKAGCDTEEFLNWWNLDPENHSHPNVLHDNWKGYGAMFILREGKLKLIKDNSASLYGAKRAKGGWVWSTEKHDGERICNAVGIELVTRFMKVPPVICDFNLAGDPVGDVSWSGFGNRFWDAKATQSLGYEYGGCGTYVSRSTVPTSAGVQQAATYSAAATDVTPTQVLSKRQRKKLARARLRAYNQRSLPNHYQAPSKTESFPDWEGGSTYVGPDPRPLTYKDVMNNQDITEQ